MAFISNRPSFLYLGLKRKVWTEIRGTFESLPRIRPKTYQFLGVQHEVAEEREREVDKTACGHSRSIGGDRCSCQSFVANHRQNDVDRCAARSHYDLDPSFPGTTADIHARQRDVPRGVAR